MFTIERFIGIVLRRKLILLACLTVFFLTPLILAGLYKPVYRSSSQMRIMFNETATPYLAGVPDRVGKFEYSDKNKVANTFFAMIKNPDSIAKVITKLNIKDKNGKLIDSNDFSISSQFSLFFKNVGIGVDSVESGEVIEVIGYGPTLERSAAITNSAVDTFVNLYSNMFQSQANDAKQALLNNLNDTNKELRVIEKNKLDLLKKNSIIDIPTDISKLADRYYDYTKSANQFSIDIEAAKENLKGILAALKKIPKMDLASQAVERNTLIDGYKKDLVANEVEIVKLAIDFKENHPSMQAKRKQSVELRNAIHAEIEKVMSSETTSLNSIYTDLEKKLYDTQISLEVSKKSKEIIEILARECNKELIRIKGIQLEANDLDRITDAMKVNYTSIQAALLRIEAVLKMTPSNLVVLNYAKKSAAETDKPYFPNKGKLLAMSLFLGLTLGFCIILVEEASDTSIRSAEDIKSPQVSVVLMGLPEIRRNKIFPWRHLATSDIAERKEVTCSAWNVISGISAAYGGVLPRSMLFTGAHPSVGTSTTAFIVSRELALQGKKTLLLNISSRGLSEDLHDTQNFVDASDQFLSRLTVETKIPGLYVADFRKGTRIKSLVLIDNLEEQLRSLDFNCVIIDSDSMSVNNDSILALKLANALVVLVMYGKTSQDSLQALLNNVESVDSGKKAVVLLNRA